MRYQDGLLTVVDVPCTDCNTDPVPEPSTLFILGAALVLAYLAHRWVRRVSAR